MMNSYTPQKQHATQPATQHANGIKLPGEINKTVAETTAPTKPTGNQLSKALNRFMSAAQQALNTSPKTNSQQSLRERDPLHRDVNPTNTTAINTQRGTSNAVAPLLGGHAAGFQESLKRFSHAVPRPDDKKLSNNSAYQLTIKADTERYRNRLETAEELYNQAIAIDVAHVDAWTGLGKTFREQGRPVEACKALRQALRQNAFDVDIQLELAKSYNEAGNPKRAITWYERALKLAPENNEARFGLALLVELCGDMDYAATLYEAVLDIDDTFLPAYNNLGSIYLRMGEYSSAEGFFKQLIERSPEFHRGYLGLGITLDRSGRTSEALFYYRTVLSMKATGHNNQFIEDRINEIMANGFNQSAPLRRVK